MSLPRSEFAAVTLPNGKVLLIGGLTTNFAATATVDLYDPASDTVTAAAPMSTPRFGHSATLLPNGKVLVAGGEAPGYLGPGTASAEIYDPAANRWTAAASMARARAEFPAVLLPNGKVFVAGGAGGGEEIYDPVTNTWTVAQTMYNDRINGPAVAALKDGRVLIYGGQAVIEPGNQFEVFDTTTGQASSGNAMPLSYNWSTAAVLPDGSVMFVGGQAGYQPNGPVNTTIVFPGWTAGPVMNAGHCHHTMTTLKGGALLVVAGGGCGGAQPNAVAELYDPSSKTWLPAGMLATPRGGHVAALLGDGRVLIAGGFITMGAPIATMEIYTPA